MDSCCSKAPVWKAEQFCADFTTLAEHFFPCTICWHSLRQTSIKGVITGIVKADFEDVPIRLTSAH